MIIGPTGVGKTKLSVELAKSLKGEIINGDSTQVYKYLNIGTAKIMESEKEGIIHHLFDMVEPSDEYTVFNYQKEGRKKITEIIQKGKIPIIVGGSGLYLKALLYDYSFEKESQTISYEMYQLEDLYKKLLEIDPETTIAKNNRQRIERALVFYEEHGFPISMQETASKILYDATFIGLTTNRELLYQRIEKRAEIMIESGLLGEVKELYKKYPTSKILHSAIGYKELIEYYQQKLSLEEAISKIKHNSTTYAKRQYTWFNNQMEVKWYQVDFSNFNQTIAQIKKDL